MASHEIHSRLGILAPLKEWGGLEREIVILCREFLKLGVQPQLILTREGVTPYPHKLPSEVEVIDLQSKRKFDATFKLIGHLKSHNLDALLTYKDHAAKVAVLARLIGRIDIPVFVKITNTLSQTLRRPAKRQSALWLYCLANKMIANSQGIKEDLIKHFNMPSEGIEVIYNPTFTEELLEQTRQTVDHPWLNHKEVPVLISTGRLNPAKDFITLVEAFSRLQDRHPSRLIILGEGPERQNIEEKAKELGVEDKIDLPGYVQDPVPWLASADVFVLSSRYEGLPNALIEALVAGNPVVSTNCPSGPSEILQSGRLGPLVPVGDASRMADSISSVLQDPPQPELIRGGLERFRSDVVARQNMQLMGLLGGD